MSLRAVLFAMCDSCETTRVVDAATLGPALTELQSMGWNYINTVLTCPVCTTLTPAKSTETEGILGGIKL